ncbi:PepSY domain-containing protein [Candidatus Nitrosoglobus terrae]|uniref:PepSY domain-containing protein n=1 Tax=Candidatus Nitrosoglobus terrae TaxID=1630141 RepID=UPI000BBAFF10|nr:PepSY domain-containing protein [Candidatus Nitrosoglobus terrae]
MINKTVNPSWRAALAAFLLLASWILKAELSHEEALHLRQAGTVLPFEHILTFALNRYPGALLLESELERKKGIYVYKLELLTSSGIVRELKINAGNSELIKDELDD